MGDVIVIGGGLTGLSAAWELERLGISYTLIEVKDRVGGSIHTLRENGFVLDAASFLLEKRGKWDFLDMLDMKHALSVVSIEQSAQKVIFKKGTQTVIDALTATFTAPVMLRMAVSSVGRLDNGLFSVCLENGLMMTARALVIAIPARYAERVLRSLQPEVAFRLLDYRYDSVARASLGYRRDEIGAIPTTPPDGDYPITFWHVTDHPSRVPPDHLLIRAGVRLEVEDVVPDNLPLEIAALMQWPLNPTVARVDYWPEADPLTCHGRGHEANMTAIERLLPPGVALAGSDYRGLRFDQRVEQGRAAALDVTNWLRQ
jgi:protoporphyrinogen oxidase